MPKPRQDYAIVEWDFIRFDPRYRSLPDDEARAYLHLWATCIHTRRDAFSKDEIEGSMLPDMAGVNAESFRRMVASALASGLLSRGPGGRVTVVGIRGKHPSLTKWNDGGLKLESCDPVSEDRKGKERTGEDQSTAPCADIQEAWNNVAAKAGCVKCRDLTDSRKRKIKTRWRDKNWRDHWLDAINLLPERKFALGDNDRAWRMDFDFFLKPDTVTGILEGKYMGGSASGKKAVPQLACSHCLMKNLPPQSLTTCASCGKTLLCWKCINHHNCGETKGGRDGD